MEDTTMRPLNERQKEILSGVADHDGRDSWHIGMSSPGWIRPMDLGGHDGSDESRILAQLCKRGLVERFDRSMVGGRGSYLYRITEEGRKYLSDAQQ